MPNLQLFFETEMARERELERKREPCIRINCENQSKMHGSSVLTFGIYIFSERPFRAITSVLICFYSYLSQPPHGGGGETRQHAETNAKQTNKLRDGNLLRGNRGCEADAGEYKLINPC